MGASAWWRVWEPGVHRELDAADLAAARAHPRFHDALRRSTLGALELNDADPEYHRIIVDAGALVLGVVALYLDATGGLTHRRLRELVGVKGVLSGGRVSALLLRMQMIGYVYATSDHRPGTPKLWRPTAKMTAAFRTRFRVELEAVMLMAPALESFLAVYDQPDGFRDFVGTVGRFAAETIHRPRADLRGFLEITSRQAGYAVLMAALGAASAAAGRFPASGPAPVSVAALSKRFRVSRTHVLSLLRQAEAAGYLVRDVGDGERAVVLPALVDAFEIYYSGIYIGLALIIELSLAERLGVDRRSPEARRPCTR